MKLYVEHPNQNRIRNMDGDGDLILEVNVRIINDPSEELTEHNLTRMAALGLRDQLTEIIDPGLAWRLAHPRECAAVREVLNMGRRIRLVADKYGVSKSTIRRWMDCYQGILS